MKLKPLVFILPALLAVLAIIPAHAQYVITGGATLYDISDYPEIVGGSAGP